MELIVVIVIGPFLIPALVVLFVPAVWLPEMSVLFFGPAFGLPKPTVTPVSPLTITSKFPSALINRGAMPPIKLLTKPNTTAVFTKLVNFLFLP